MLRPFLAASAACLLAATPNAYAELTYSYVEGSVLVNRVDTDTVGEQDGQGFEAKFSYDVLKFLHVFAEARRTELDDLPIDQTMIAAGAGVHYAPHDRASIYFDLGALSLEADISGSGTSASADDDGYLYAFGYREENKTGRMQFDISAEHVELNDADTGDTYIKMGLMFRATPRFKVTTMVQFAGDENAFNVGVRYDLPNRFLNRTER
jgi:hypothetical protein